MASQATIIDTLYSKLPTLSATDHKIAQYVLTHPNQVVNMTISALAQAAGVSDASVSRFSKNIGLDGFHQLKIELARVAENQDSYYQQINPDDFGQALQSISANKVAEINSTLAQTAAPVLKQIVQAIAAAPIVQVAGAGGTFPVAADAVYKFNQLGKLAITDSVWDTAVAQTLNLPQTAVLLVISNSGETRDLLTQVNVAKKRGIKVVAITNHADSPIAQRADLHMLTAVRQRVFESEYYFSRVAAMTAVEAIFLLLLADDKTRLKHIKQHESIVATTKI